jgi:NADP-dependent 3-hydroxy acid dehydrogenase YdfG
MSHFADRTVLITGAANGIGRGFAQALARLGARVGAIDRHAEGLAELARELGSGHFASAVADVTDAVALAKAAASLEAKLGPTDMLIACAGLIHETAATDFRPENFAVQVEVNLIGVANSMAAVLPGMLARKSGHLVAISSIAAYHGVAPLAGYCASKAGVNALCDAFRVELRPLGIRVTTICPGFIRTHIADHLDIPKPPAMLSVEDAVNRMLGAIARGREFFAFPSGNVWWMRLLRYLPRRLGDWVAARRLARLNRSRARAAARAANSPA